MFHGTLMTCDILGVSSSQYQREVKMSKGHVQCNQTVSFNKTVEQDHFQSFINKEHVSLLLWILLQLLSCNESYSLLQGFIT